MATETLTARFERLKQTFCDERFLQNKGLSNEVGIHVFCYDPKEEMTLRRCIRQLQSMTGQPFHIVTCDLYEIFLSICQEKRILASIPATEQKKGSEFLLRQLQRIATPEAFVERMRYEPHRAGDILLLTGVGKVYPFMRAHSILDNLQPVFSDMPVVLMYPGQFDGQKLSLFGQCPDGNYYRAFQLL